MKFKALGRRFPYLTLVLAALGLAGPDRTREGLLEAINFGFDGSWTCSICPTPTMLGPNDHWLYEDWTMTHWNNAEKRYETFSEVSHETNEGLRLRGNFSGVECQPPSAGFPREPAPGRRIARTSPYRLCWVGFIRERRRFRRLSSHW
jgi:hypothetical protein